MHLEDILQERKDVLPVNYVKLLAQLLQLLLKLNLEMMGQEEQQNMTLI